MSDMTDRDRERSGARMDETRRPVTDPVGSSDPRDRGAFDFRRREPPAADDESISSLLRRLTEQGSHLAQQQAALVEAEVRSSVNHLKEAAAAMAGAAVVGIAGLGVFLMGLAYLLGEAMEMWLATLIVAVATLAGAYAMYVGGKKKLQSGSFTADRSRRTIERAPGAITGHRDEGLNNGR